jgi:hypothetical protein
MSTFAIPMFPMFLNLQNNWNGTKPSEVFLESYLLQQNQGIEEVAPFSESLTRLYELLTQNGEDDYGILGPSQLAFHSAFGLVARAEKLMTTRMSGSPSVDSTGGIRMTWRYLGNEIRLVCPSTNAQKTYIYQQAGNTQRETMHNVTPALLAEKLTWLASGADTL